MFKGSIAINKDEKHAVKGHLELGKEKKLLFVFGMNEARGTNTIYCSKESTELDTLLEGSGLTKYTGAKDFKFDPERFDNVKGGTIIALGISKNIRDAMKPADYCKFLIELAEAAFAGIETNESDDITPN